MLRWADTGLPGIQLTGWSYKQKTNMVVSEMELGPPKRHHRGTKSYGVLKGSLLLSASELRVFVDFVTQSLRYGVDPFVWQDFMSGTDKIARLNIKKNGDLYSVSEKKKGQFSVSLELEIES